MMPARAKQIESALSLCTKKLTAVCQQIQKLYIGGVTFRTKFPRHTSDAHGCGQCLEIRLSKDDAARLTCHPQHQNTSEHEECQDAQIRTAPLSLLT